MRCTVFTDLKEMYGAIAEGSTDLAIVYDPQLGTSHCRMLNDREIPSALQRLPGYRQNGISGVPGPAVVHFLIARTPEEIKAAVRDAQN